jgi:hypothetical protein
MRTTARIKHQEATDALADKTVDMSKDISTISTTVTMDHNVTMATPKQYGARNANQQQIQ